MVDNLRASDRSALMARVRNRNTKPEIRVRSQLHRLGYRFRTCISDLPGSPDVVIRKHKIALFVHGCFWHGHARCRAGRLPKSNVNFWGEKVSCNRARDKAVRSRLRALGWRVMTIWECQTKRVSFARVLEKRMDRLVHAKD